MDITGALERTTAFKAVIIGLSSELNSDGSNCGCRSIGESDRHNIKAWLFLHGPIVVRELEGATRTPLEYL